jgi:hypothetical protein
VECGSGPWRSEHGAGSTARPRFLPSPWAPSARGGGADPAGKGLETAIRATHVRHAHGSMRGPTACARARPRSGRAAAIPLGRSRAGPVRARPLEWDRARRARRRRGHPSVCKLCASGGTRRGVGGAVAAAGVASGPSTAAAGTGVAFPA